MVAVVIISELVGSGTMILALLENPRWLGLPATTWIIIGWFLLACVQTLQKDTHREVIQGGRYAENDEHHQAWDTFGSYISLLFFVQYGLLISLYFFDGNFNRMAVVWVGTFILAVVARPVMRFIGSVVISPLGLAWKKFVIKG